MEGASTITLRTLALSMRLTGPVRKEDNMKEGKSQARGITLNVLKDELYSLNRRMLLALQNHDEAEQARITKEIAAVQEKISARSFRDSSSG